MHFSKAFTRFHSSTRCVNIVIIGFIILLGHLLQGSTELFMYFLYIKNYIGTQGDVCTVKGL